MLSQLIKSFFLFLPLSLMANFSSSSDTTWKYHFQNYSNVGGILDSNKTSPLYTMDESILSSLLSSLPENRRADQQHPEYFPTPEPEIIVKEGAEVFVTFYHEGAGYKNTLGYYTYDGDTNRSRPQSLQDIKDEGVVLFANTSLLYSGGDLIPETTVSLGHLSSGTKVIFFLVSNGWKGSSTGVRSSYDWIFTSWSPLNKEYDATSTKEVPDHKHVALLWKGTGAGNILLMGFEDILRTSNSCDHDYNDVLFAVSSSPLSALTDTTEVETGTSGFSVAQSNPEETDTDNDGVNDAYDSYPNDNQRAYNSYYPNSNSKSTLVFEDMWPFEGDYDMNDLSIGFSIQEVKNINYEVKDILFTGNVQSYGASYTNGFSIILDTPLENIESIEFNNGNDAAYSILDAAQADGSSTIIKVFEDAADFLGHYANVYKNNEYQLSTTFELNITLKTASELSNPPYNPFLTTNVAGNSVEIHLPNHLPSSYASLALFATEDDTTNLGSSRTYLTAGNKPWALLIPTYFANPIEQVDIEEAYVYYLDWVASNGSTNNDWYLQSKANIEKVITKP